MITGKHTLEGVLARTICILMSIGLSFWAALMSVGWWYHGTGITKVGKKYLLRKGYVVIDPGQMLGRILYAMSWTMIFAIGIAFILALILLNKAGHVEEFKEAFTGSELAAYRRVFRIATFTIVIPFIVQLLSWVLK